MLSEIVKVVDGGGGDLKCCRPEIFLVCRKNVSVCLKSTARLPLPPPLKHWSYGATAHITQTKYQKLKNNFSV